MFLGQAIRYTDLGHKQVAKWNEVELKYGSTISIQICPFKKKKRLSVLFRMAWRSNDLSHDSQNTIGSVLPWPLQHHTTQGQTMGTTSVRLLPGKPCGVSISHLRLDSTLHTHTLQNSWSLHHPVISIPNRQSLFFSANLTKVHDL